MPVWDWRSTQERGKDCSTASQPVLPRDGAALGTHSSQPGVGHGTEGLGRAVTTAGITGTESLRYAHISFLDPEHRQLGNIQGDAWGEEVSLFIYLYCIFMIIGTSCIHLALLIHLRKHRAQGNLTR